MEVTKARTSAWLFSQWLLFGIFVQKVFERNLNFRYQPVRKSEKIKIEAPTKGKEVDQKEFTKIQQEKTKEMMEKFKGRNGMDIGGGINIKMSGN